MSRRAAVWLAAALGLSGGLVGVGLTGIVAALAKGDDHVPEAIRAGIEAPCRDKDVILGAPGPWGQLETRPILLAPPSRLTKSSSCHVDPSAWTFPEASWPLIDSWLAHAGMSSVLREELGRRVQCEEVGCIAYPEADWVLRVPAEVRTTLYPLLAALGNHWVVESLRTGREAFEARLATTTLPEAARARLRQLSFVWDGEVVFADIASVCAMLDAPGRAELMRFLHMEEALIVRLRVAEGQDVAPLVRYWSRGEFGRELAALLESLSRRPGGGRVDVINLLPPLPRVLLNTYPDRTDDNRNCFWSAMNFLATEPDDRLKETDVVTEERLTRYEVVTDAPRLGDVYEFGAFEEHVGHMAVHIADGIVFTKNGLNAARPWILATLDSVRKQYASNEGGFVRRLRRIDP
jgi:hypothetical protein